MGVPLTSSLPGSSKPKISLAKPHISNQPLPSFTTTNEEYVHHLYRHAAEDQEIHAFLEESDSYDIAEKKWAIPTAPTRAEDLLDSVVEMLSSIVQRFGKPSQSGVEREVVNTQDIPACQGTNEKGYRICPVVVVRAAGPSFEIPKPRNPTESSQEPSKSIGFGGMATYYAVRPESESGSEKEDLDEMGSYARRILYAQPNRYHVRSLVLTEKHARLVHFDRSGSQVSPLIDIHKHPVTFIRLVTGLSSTNERLLGIDDSVQWTIVNGKKDKGTLTTTSANGDTKVYPIIEEIPIPRDSIRGRATTCWRVEDPDTSEELVVKDSWRPDDRPAEHELLELVKGVPGVVQMVSCETARRETKDMRCPSTTGQYQNRVFERVTMKAYGGPIESFKTVLQLLCAIRDAVAGHQRLVDEDIRILHRDISPHNILLGREGAPEGERAVLIDLDMAFRATDAHLTATADYNIGTRIFQSLSVLNSHDHRQGVRAHDYLDDLESFFYLLVYIFLRFRPDGSAVPNQEEGPSIVKEWADDCPSTASGRKNLILSPGRVGARSLRVVEGTWGTVCGALFKGFRRWVTQVRSTKTALLYKGSRAGDPTPLSVLHSQREEHYCEVLAMFDEAITAISPSAVIPSCPPPEELTSASHSVAAANQPSQPPAVPIPEGSPTVELTESTDTEGPLSPVVETVASAIALSTPPRLTQPSPHSEPSPSTPNCKRRSKDNVRPESPGAKARRVSAGPTTLPMTPPRSVISPLSAHASPSSPTCKRRSEDAAHPESPPTKARRLNIGLLLTSRSP